MASFCLVLGVCVLVSLLPAAVPAPSLPTPYLIFSTGATIERVEPDGSDHVELISGLRGAVSLDYNYGMNKLFFTSVSDGVVYETELESSSGEYHPIPIINVNNPRGLAVAGSMLLFSHREVRPTYTAYHIAVYEIGGEPGREYMNIECQSTEIRELVVNGGILYYTTKEEVFRKQLPAGTSEKLYSADHGDCISSLAFEGSHLFWAEGCSAIDDIVSIDLDLSYPYNPTTISALHAQNGVDVDGNTVYWTGIGKVYKAPVATGDLDREEVINLLSSHPTQLKGLVVVKP